MQIYDLAGLARFGLALSDATRLRLLLALQSGELCACQLVDLAGLANSTVSRHLAVLEQAGLVTHRKAGRWVHYRLARPRPLTRALLRELAGLAELEHDRRRLRALRASDLEALCRKQRKG